MPKWSKPKEHQAQRLPKTPHWSDPNGQVLGQKKRPRHMLPIKELILTSNEAGRARGHGTKSHTDWQKQSDGFHWFQFGSIHGFQFQNDHTLVCGRNTLGVGRWSPLKATIVKVPYCMARPHVRSFDCESLCKQSML